MTTQYLNLDALAQAELIKEPFPHVVIPQLVDMSKQQMILRDFPKINDPGSFPLSKLQYGEYFANLIADIEGDELRQVIADKFAMDLSNFPVYTTVRGHTRLRDGKIHTDTMTKKITMLLYLNDGWQAVGGRLRLLYDGYSMENYFKEVTPNFGTCILFKVTNNGWHGHLPYEGVRRTLQMNYLSGELALRQHIKRHERSAWFKQLKNKFS